MPTPQFETIQSKLQENSLSFNEACLQVFQFQAENNPVYKAFLAYLGVLPANILNYTAIPFLPIQFFKSKTVTCFESVWAEKVYLSSASSGGIQSKHFVKHYADYQQSFTKAFELFYGNPADYCVIALLPSYLEREGSSLIDMAEELIKLSNNPHSGFYLNDYQALIKVLSALYQQGKKTLVIGVTFALLDLAELGTFNWPNTIFMETGGMKGKRKELTREELHASLSSSFGVQHIHSEYGMTELLSQAYSKGNGLFSCPPWMMASGRDIHDPLSSVKPGKTGGLNIIDLANIHSCSFIATQDLCKIHENGQFEVLGRFDQSDIRGCNLMVV